MRALARPVALATTALAALLTLQGCAVTSGAQSTAEATAPSAAASATAVAASVQDAVAQPLLPLQGGRNFRDLGGYASSDGREVRRGVIYRSGTMAFLTEADHRQLGAFGIRTVVDFRANDERMREPTDWQAIGASVEYLTRDYVMDTDGFRRLFATGVPTPEAVHEVMKGFYATMPYEFAGAYSRMFREIVNGDVPLVFHCSAGKDRTGGAAALLLTVLGVPRETIVADYALSDQLVDYEKEMVAGRPAPQGDDPWAFITRLPPDVRAPLLRSDPAYIRQFLETIERREGSVDAYLERELGLSAADRATIRRRLLQ